jgi:hypothetical protein
MSKKLIAVASAAALALSALVGLPANASAFAVTPTGQTAGTGATAATAFTVNVPTSDVMRYSATASQTSTIKFAVTATTATGAVTATATGSVRLLTQEQLDDTANTDSKTGTTSVSVAAAGFAASIYAYNTSVENGTVTISNGGNTVVYNVKGIAGKAYKMTITSDSTASKGIDFKLAATVVDMFGNPVTGLVEDNFQESGFGAFASPTLTLVSGSKGVYNLKLQPGASGAGLLTVKLASGVLAAEEELSFGKLADSVTVSVNSADPAAQIAALTAQVAALQASLQATVTKKKYNKLARKWNRANPSNKVKLSR